jgi:hypothetical protein
MVKQHTQPPPVQSHKGGRERRNVPAAELGEQIGHKLREMFNDVVTEPVPEKFRLLLEELEHKSSNSGE